MSIVAEKKMAEKKIKEDTTNPSSYSCEILLEKVSLQQLKDPSYPTDAYIVSYTTNDEDYLDLCRGGKRVNIFDYYYDKYGPQSVKSINWGYGRVSPRSWGFKSPEKKKRR